MEEIKLIDYFVHIITQDGGLYVDTVSVPEGFAPSAIYADRCSKMELLGKQFLYLENALMSPDAIAKVLFFKRDSGN